MRFELATAGRVIFGAGTIREVAPAAREFGRRALLVTGRAAERASSLAAALAASGVEPFYFRAEAEPSVELIRAGVEQARGQQCDLVIGFGGGSAIDTAKAIAALLANGGEILDYLELIGGGKPLNVASAPFIAVPTTAGTGAEVTRNAVLVAPKHRAKVSLRSPRMLARLAVVDPDLTVGLPARQTAESGLDALAQLIEPFVSAKANPLTDGFCLQGLPLAARALGRAFRNGRDKEARQDMALAALLGGLALANAGLGVVHGLAGPIGGIVHAPHGALVAALLSYGMAANVRALRLRAPRHEALRRYTTIAQIFTGNTGASAEDGVDWVYKLCQELNVRPLAAHGVRTEDAVETVEITTRASSMKANPIGLTGDELRGVLERALGSAVQTGESSHRDRPG